MSSDEEYDDVPSLDGDQNKESLQFDFEALPPETSDVDQIGNLLTQVCINQ